MFQHVKTKENLRTVEMQRVINSSLQGNKSKHKKNDKEKNAHFLKSHMAKNGIHQDPEITRNVVANIHQPEDRKTLKILYKSNAFNKEKRPITEQSYNHRFLLHTGQISREMYDQYVHHENNLLSTQKLNKTLSKISRFNHSMLNIKETNRSSTLNIVGPAPDGASTLSNLTVPIRKGIPQTGNRRRDIPMTQDKSNFYSMRQIPNQ